MADRDTIVELTAHEANELYTAARAQLGAAMRFQADVFEGPRDPNEGRLLKETHNLAGAMRALHRAQADAERLRTPGESHPRGSTSRVRP